LYHDALQQSRRIFRERGRILIKQLDLLRIVIRRRNGTIEAKWHIAQTDALVGHNDSAANPSHFIAIVFDP
jgi:hypothetical protein